MTVPTISESLSGSAPERASVRSQCSRRFRTPILICRWSTEWVIFARSRYCVNMPGHALVLKAYYGKCWKAAEHTQV